MPIRVTRLGISLNTPTKTSKKQGRHNDMSILRKIGISLFTLLILLTIFGFIWHWAYPNNFELFIDCNAKNNIQINIYNGKMRVVRSIFLYPLGTYEGDTAISERLKGKSFVFVDGKEAWQDTGEEYISDQTYRHPWHQSKDPSEEINYDRYSLFLTNMSNPYLSALFYDTLNEKVNLSNGLTNLYYFSHNYRSFFIKTYYDKDYDDINANFYKAILHDLQEANDLRGKIPTIHSNNYLKTNALNIEFSNNAD